MLTHPDPQIQVLFNDITEQRDVSMVKCANLQVQFAAAQVEIAALKAKLQELDTTEKPALEVVK